MAKRGSTTGPWAGTISEYSCGAIIPMNSTDAGAASGAAGPAVSCRSWSDESSDNADDIAPALPGGRSPQSRQDHLTFTRRPTSPATGDTPEQRPGGPSAAQV